MNQGSISDNKNTININKITQYKVDDAVNVSVVMDYFKTYTGERYVFINKEKSFKLIGIGHHTMIAADMIQPTYVQHAFENAMSAATFDGYGNKSDLKLFGGFHFDENDSPDFSAFHKSHFIIPRIQIMECDGITTIMFVDCVQDIQLLTDALSHHDLHEIYSNDVVSIEDLDIDLFRSNAQSAIAMMQEEKLDKVVLSRKRKVTMHDNINVLNLLEHAKMNHEISYFALIESGSQVFITKTPEQLVAVSGGIVHTNAIAGTMGKYVDNAKMILLEDEKNLYEHQIVVDSIKHDLLPFTQDIILKAKPDILENQFFYHLYTPIKAKLSDGGLLEVTERLHPTPALGGFPKKAAKSFIAQAGEGRGLYGAPIGYIDINNEGEFIVAIRSMVVEQKTALLFAGCGIVKSSHIESEVRETEIKFKPMLEMLGVNHYE